MPPTPESMSAPDASPNQKVDELYTHLANKRKEEGMECLLESDLEPLDDILAGAARDITKYDKEKLTGLFTLIEQLAASESFRDANTKDTTLRQIQLYRAELEIK